MKLTKKEKKERIESLKDLIKPGDKIFTKLNHVSRSGMYRVIDLYVIRDGEPLRITFCVSVALGDRYDRKHEGLSVEGGGMDVGFGAVYNLSHVLFPGGFGCIGEHCPSNDHSNGDRDYTPNGGLFHGMAQETEHRTHWHNDGGYALKQSWL